MKHYVEILKNCKIGDKDALVGNVVEITDDDDLVKQMVDQGIAKVRGSGYESKEEKFEDRKPFDRRPAGPNKMLLAGFGSSHKGDSGGYQAKGDTGDFKNIGELFIAVKDAQTKGRFDDRLKALSEGVGADGGFLVPQGFSEGILRDAIELSPILNRVRSIPMSSNTTKLPAVDETSRASNVYGGILFKWLAESGTKEESTPKFRQIGIELKKLAGYCNVSDELLEDAPSLSALLPTMMSEALSFQIADVILSGNGAGMPLGILNSPCLITISKEVGQAAQTIDYLNLVKMFARLSPSSYPSAMWLASPTCIPSLKTAKLVLGSTAYPMVLPQDMVGLGEIFGLPVTYTELCRGLGTRGDIVLADMRQYLLAQKTDLRIDVSNAPRFINDETTYRIVYRCDGQPWWNSPRMPKYGTDTVSPFLCIETR